jgi:DNA-directed RNA polymerase subunit N
MIVPIRCFTCGNLVGDKYSDFQQRVKSGEDPKKVLDSLGLKRYCCRRILITSMDIVDQLMPYNEALYRRHSEYTGERM